MHAFSYRLLLNLPNALPLRAGENVNDRSFTRFSLPELEDELDTAVCYIVGPEEFSALANQHPQCTFLTASTPTCPLDNTPSNGIVCAEPLDKICLFKQINALIKPYFQWADSLQAALLKDCSFQELFNLSEHMLKNWTAMVDSSRSLVAHTPGIAIDDETCQELIQNHRHSDETMRALLLRHSQADLERHSRHQLFIHHESLRYPTISKTFFKDGESRFHVIMVANVEELSPHSADVFELFLDFINLLFESSKTRRTNLRQPKDVLFSVLAEESAENIGAALDLAHNMGIDGYEEYVFGIARSENSSFSALSSCATFLQEYIPDVLLSLQESSILFLFFGSPAQLHQLLAGPHSLALSFLEMRQTHLFLSAGCTQFQDLQLAHKQALAALSVFELRKSQGSSSQGSSDEPTPILFFQDVFFEWLLTINNHNRAFERYCLSQRFAARLAKEDPEAFQLLETYLRCERSTTRASGDLFMNRSTILYRVRLIEEKYGVSLDCPQVRLEFNLIAWMLRQNGYPA